VSARALVCLVCLVAAGHSERVHTSAQPVATEPRSPRNASYTIDARLNPRERLLAGDERLTWRNTAAIPAETLRFHLYYNAWRNTASSWMRERGLVPGDPDAARRRDTDWGWIDVSSVRLGDGTDLTPRLRYIAPDDGNADDRTVLEVPLDRPVAPGETVDVRLAWTSHIPRTFARTGAIGNFFFIAQWFPKIGVLEDSGWNCHQFHAVTEFFADFGSYDVRLTVPTGWIVGATGTERGRQEGADGTTTHRFQQDDVHDFAWTTSPDYVEHRARFEHPTLPAVEMRLLLQREHAGQEGRHFDATRATLKYYGEWFGPYPYGHITIVDPAWQSNAGGMEYPTLFTAGTRWWTPRRAAVPEGVTVHEAGHQFWYGIVATNEFEHGWMDEGLNTFSTARVLQAAGTPNDFSKRYFGGFIPWTFADLPFSRVTDGDRLGAFRRWASAETQSRPTWRYYPPAAGSITYDKTALWLHTLEGVLGWDTLQRVLSTYFTRGAFRHPRPEEFFAVASEVSGRDLTPFFDQVHRGSGALDYGIDAFRSEPAAVGGHDAAGAAPAGPPLFRTTVVVRRFGDMVLPVDVRVTFDNGDEQRWTWDGRDRWQAFEAVRPVRAARAEVDPEHALVLDVRYTNNSATRSPKARSAARKWSLAWLVWLQDQLMTYGFFV
jgi:Peptidase family M1 domain